MRVVLALLTALVVGTVALLVIGPVPAAIVVVLVVGAGVVAQRDAGGLGRPIGIVLLVALLGVGSYGAILTVELLEALATTEGVVDPVDAAALEAAEAKIGEASSGSAFRLELDEAELEAVVQEGLVSARDTIPVRRVDLDLRGATRDLAFTASFKSGAGVVASGTAQIRAEAGGIEVDLGPLDFGRLQVPGLAAGAVQEVLAAVTDLNAALLAERASVQSVEVGEDVLVVTGTRATPDVLTDAQLLDAILAQAGGALGSVEAPPERIGRGVEASLDAPGSPVVLAVGDSLAANVGVDDPRDGYVSRVHAAVQRADGRSYGLRNLGVPGETSGTLLSGGQLEQAEAVLAARPATLVLLDIGANDLLGHLTSADCSADLASGPCQRRVEETLVAYRANLATILDRLTAAAGDARVVLLQAYNPFSLGIGESTQARASSAILRRLNQVAAEEAARRGVVVADGFTPMEGTTAATTHMLDPEPDIHPNAAGYDVLAAAIVDAL